MNWTLYLMLLVLSLHPGSVITREKTADAIRTLQSGGTAGEQCPPARGGKRESKKWNPSKYFLNNRHFRSHYYHSPNDNHNNYAHHDWLLVDQDGGVLLSSTWLTPCSYNCPTGLNLTSYSKRTCGRPNADAGYSSTTFSVGGLPYSDVCGRINLRDTSLEQLVLLV